MKQSNALKYDLLYNGDTKRGFIEAYTSIDSKLTLYWQFLKIANSKYKGEYELKKDISEMNNKEIEELLEEIKCSTITSAINHINTYKRYIDWTINNHSNTNVNPFDSYESLSELASQVVASEKNTRYSRDELMFMLDELNNYTDQALLLAIFEGIKGKSFSELLTLKRSNLTVIDTKTETNYFAKVYDEGSKSYRTIKISQDLYKLLILADEQYAYITNNKDEYIETAFNDSEFIFKKAKKGKQDGNILDRHFITRKFVFFKKFFGNRYLTVDDIAQSGMMYMAYKLYSDRGRLGKAELLEIGEQYNTIMASTARTESYRNITVLKRIIFIEQLGHIYDEMSDVEYAD